MIGQFADVEERKDFIMQSRLGILIATGEKDITHHLNLDRWIIKRTLSLLASRSRHYLYLLLVLFFSYYV